MGDGVVAECGDAVQASGDVAGVVASRDAVAGETVATETVVTVVGVPEAVEGLAAGERMLVNGWGVTRVGSAGAGVDEV